MRKKKTMHNKRVNIFLLLFTFLIHFPSAAFAIKYEDLLDEYIAAHGFEKICGHCCSKGTNQPAFIKKLIKLNPQIKKIAEIGFNAGHSSVLFLESNPKVTVCSFDIMHYDYVLTGKEFVDEHFPNRHTLIEGNSTGSVPRFQMENPETKFDLIFIDGCHKYKQVLIDILNMRELAHEDTILFIDDLHLKGVERAYEECLEKEIIKKGTISQSKFKIWTLCKYIFN